MFLMISPNMLKTYELCPRKFYLRYVKNISMPVNDDIFEFGKTSMPLLHIICAEKILIKWSFPFLNVKLRYGTI